MSIKSLNLTEADKERIQEQIWINHKGQIVYDSRLKANTIDTLNAFIEDAMYEEDGAERIDWNMVWEEYEKAC